MHWAKQTVSLAILTSSAIFGQPASSPPAFEVASIKPADPLANSSGTHTAPGKLTMTNMTLKRCILYAYRIQDYQVSGGPDWLDKERYNIDAKADAPPEKLTAAANRERMEAMLQTLLADRFKLAIHRETKVLPAYTLVVAKNGPKLREVEPGTGTSTSTGRGRLTAKSISIPGFATLLSGLMDRPVVDMTGIKGVFELKMEWTPDDNQPAVKPAGNEESATVWVDKPSGPSIFTAIQEQLGLKLEAQKAPVEKLVVDHAEKPTEN